MARNKYDVDEIYEEHFDLGQLKRLGRYVLPYKKDMIIAAVLMLSSSAATMLIPRFFMTVMNDMIPNKDVQGLVQISLLTLLVILYSVFALRIKIKHQHAFTDGRHGRGNINSRCGFANTAFAVGNRDNFHYFFLLKFSNNKITPSADSSFF